MYFQNSIHYLEKTYVLWQQGVREDRFISIGNDMHFLKHTLLGSTWRRMAKLLDANRRTVKASLCLHSLSIVVLRNTAGCTLSPYYQCGLTPTLTSDPPKGKLFLSVSQYVEIAFVLKCHSLPFSVESKYCYFAFQGQVFSP